jgi:hypothetical protein
MMAAHSLAGVEMRTMERERRGNIMAEYVGSSFSPLANTSPHRVGMTEDKTPITATKIMASEAADFTATRSASSLATLVRMSSFSASTLVSRNQTFV